jgi:GNAT superfamily N-acetyltransferase
MHTEKIIRNDGSYLPKGKWEATPFSQELETTTHPFLNKFLDLGCRIHLCLDELTIFISNSILWVKIFEDHITLEYIATYPNLRRKGSGKHAMKRLVAIADATDTTLLLTTNVMLKLSGQAPAHPTLVQGVKGETRIPAPELVEWFETFGFIKGKRSNDHDFDYRGYNMQRLPE